MLQTKILNKKLHTLTQEVQLLRAGLISIIGKDTEGNYRPEFVQKIFHALLETPSEKFSDADSFLRALRKV